MTDLKFGDIVWAWDDRKSEGFKASFVEIDKSCDCVFRVYSEEHKVFHRSRNCEPYDFQDQKILKIEIISNGGCFDVVQGDKYSDGLGFDEMLGLIVHLTMRVDMPHLSWMKTKEQHDAWRDKLKEIKNENNLA